MTQRVLACATGKMKLFMKWGRLWKELVMREFVFRHVKFQMSIGHPSGEIKLAGECKSGV